ncbi:MAG: tryptophan synthase subunit alpha [Eubacteriales bacterium]
MNNRIVNNRIAGAFKNKKAFIPFFTAGDPDFDSTVAFVRAAVEAGADLIELGIPFSDPIADGPVIQAANLRAFAAGITTDRVFEMVEKIRSFTNVPLVFLTYLNPVFRYGYDKFLKKCRDVGVDGLIIPDMPIEEKGEIADIAASYDVDIISLIAPTSADRIRLIAGQSSGFLYVVSSMGVTGVRNEITTDLSAIIEAIRAVTDTPAAIGFGIHSPEQAKEYSKVADGVIVGSAIVKIIAEHGKDSAPYVADFVRSMKDAMR